MKYKGNYLPYHLRWVFNNSVKSNEIALLHEIEALENEINRLKKMKLMNREFRKLANLPFGICTTPCTCCHKLERKKHDCTHEFCDPNCAKKKAEQQMLLKESQNNFNNSYSQHIRRRLVLGNKSQIFGLIDKNKDKKSLFVIKK